MGSIADPVRCAYCDEIKEGTEFFERSDKNPHLGVCKDCWSRIVKTQKVVNPDFKEAI